MELKQFAQSFDPARAKLAEIDALVTSAGKHFNEEQVEKAKLLSAGFRLAAIAADENAMDALDVEEHTEEVLQPETEEVDDDEDREPQDGDVYVIRGGKPVRVVPDAPPPAIVGQADQLAGHPDPITAAAIGSIEAGIEAARNKEAKPPAAVTTAQVASADGVVQQVTSEGDEHDHFLEDGSRKIVDGDASEATMILVPDSGSTDSAAIAAAQGAAGEAAQFTGAPDADKPADAAAVDTGAQQGGNPEPGATQDEVDAALAKSSGIDGDAGDWTEAGMDATGFPVKKGSPEDVS